MQQIQGRAEKALLCHKGMEGLEQSEAEKMKGGVGIIGIVSGIIVLIFLGAMMPVILTQTAAVQNASAGDPVAQLAAGLIPLFLVLAVILGILASGQERQDVGF